MDSAGLQTPRGAAGGFQLNVTVNCLMDDGQAICAIRRESVSSGGRKRRVIPLNGAALAALRDQREWVRRYVGRSPWVFSTIAGGRLTTVQKGFQASCRRALIDDFRVHDLRHTFASWLVAVCPYMSSRTFWGTQVSQ